MRDCTSFQLTAGRLDHGINLLGGLQQKAVVSEPADHLKPNRQFACFANKWNIDLR
jgi:hypothetical protein